MLAPEKATQVKAGLFGLAAALIWAGWSVATRFAVTTAFDPWDIAALRFGVAGLLLLPVLLRHGIAHDRLGGAGIVAIIAGGGVPYVLLAAGGLGFATAYDQAALNPGVMPLFVALITAAVLGERHSAGQKLGLALIGGGCIAVVGTHVAGWDGARSFGHALFLAAGLLWACFTVVMQRARLDPLHATALVCCGSLVLYLPLYLPLRGARLLHTPLTASAVQAIFQGVVVTIISLLLYGRAVAILGAARAAAFGAMVPVLAALLAIPLLGEWPSGVDWAGILAISAGVYLASRAPARCANG